MPLHNAIDVTLVHGTNASHGTWFRDGSFFRRRLALALGGEVRFHEFVWDGRNSHRSRLEASLRLRARIETMSESQRHYLVCHSHGGNVALYACRAPFKCGKIDGVATFGTPFINCRSTEIVETIVRRLSEEEEYLTTVVGALVVPLMGIFSLAWLLVAPSALSSIFGQWADFVWFLVGISLLVVIAKKFGPTLSTALKVQLASLRMVQRNSLEQISAPALPKSIKLFVARTSLDEAGLWLRLMGALVATPLRLNSFWNLLMRGTYFPRTKLGLAIFTIPFSCYVYIFWPPFVDDSIPHIVTYLLAGAFLAYLLAIFSEFIGVALTVLMLTGSVLTPIIAKMARSHRLAFGREPVASLVGVEIFTTELPPISESSAVVVSVSTTRLLGLFGGLRHSVFYEDQSVVLSLARWIKGNSEEMPLRRCCDDT